MAPIPTSSSLSSIVALLLLLSTASALPSSSEQPLIFKRDRFGLPVRKLQHPALEQLKNQQARLIAKYSRQEKHLQANWAAGLVVANGREKRNVQEERLGRRQSTAGVFNVPLADQYVTADLAWLNNISVGTPSQGPFTVLPDTGSADTWLAAPGSQNFAASQEFDPSASSSFRTTGDNVSLNYNKGAFKGTVGLDTVTIGGLTVNNATVETGTVDAANFGGVDFSGIVGYAFSSISGAGRPTLISSIISAGLLAKPQFSMYLNRGFASQNDVPSQNGAEVSGGVLTLGGADSDHYQGTPESFTLRNKQHWTINMASVVIDGQTIASTSAPAAIDSGTTLIQLPDSVAVSILRAIGNTVGVDDDTQTIYAACSNLPQNWAFTFSGSNTQFDIAPDDLLFLVATGAELGLSRLDPLYRENVCVTSIGTGQTSSEVNPTTGQADPPLVVVGDAFMKNWYTTFNFGGPENDTSATASVSFAKAVPTSSNSFNQSVSAKLAGLRGSSISGGNGSAGSASGLTAPACTALVAVMGLAVGVVAVL